MSETLCLCTFRVDALFCGVPVGEVQEIIRFQDMTPVPRAPGAVRGLINLRGQIVTAVDLRARLQLKPAPAGHRSMNVIVRPTSDEWVSLLVDEIGDVIEVETERFAPAPETVRPEVGALLRGVCQLEERLLLVLALDRLLALPAEEED